MIHTPRIHGTWLRSLARLARTRAGASALEHALRAELKINELTSIPEALRGPVPLHNRARASRAPRVWEDAHLPLPNPGEWPRSSATFVSAYEARRTTPEQVTERVLVAARKLDERSPRMTVLCELAEDDARSDADDSADRYRSGVPRGPLDGVCVAIKEQTAVRGLALRAGTGFMPPDPQTRDSTVARRLREAGAIIVGSTPMTEYGMTPLGFNPNRSMPKNPHDTGHVAGGSSTGSGVAVATGLVPIAIGADGGGSIRIPSALNGVFGIKPTWGRVSREGDISGGSVAHVGPIACCTHDLARTLEIIGAPDPLDAETAYAPPIASGSLVRALSRGVKRVKVGVCETEWADASEHVARAGKEAILALEKEGAEIVPLKFDLARFAPAIGYLAISLETRGSLRDVWDRHADDMSPDLQITMAVLAQLGAVEYVDSLRLRAGLRAEMAEALSRVDVIVLPTTVDVAPAATDQHMESGFLDSHALAGLCRFNFLGNLTGLPAASVPIGMHAGLPIGFQIMGDAFDEATVLAVAAHLERIGIARALRPQVFVDVL